VPGFSLFLLFYPSSFFSFLLFYPRQSCWNDQISDSLQRSTPEKLVEVCSKAKEERRVFCSIELEFLLLATSQVWESAGEGISTFWEQVELALLS